MEVQSSLVLFLYFILELILFHLTAISREHLYNFYFSRFFLYSVKKINPLAKFGGEGSENHQM